MALYALGDQVPDIHPEAYIHPDAVVIGSVTIGARSSVWPAAVLRGDDGEIIIGEDCSVQDGAVIHTTPIWPTRLGNQVTVGHNAHLEACTVEDKALIGSGSIVLHNARIGREAIVGAGAFVGNKKVVPRWPWRWACRRSSRRTRCSPGHFDYGFSPMSSVAALSDRAASPSRSSLARSPLGPPPPNWHVSRIGPRPRGVPTSRVGVVQPTQESVCNHLVHVGPVKFRAISEAHQQQRSRHRDPRRHAWAGTSMPAPLRSTHHSHMQHGDGERYCQHHVVVERRYEVTTQQRVGRPEPAAERAVHPEHRFATSTGDAVIARVDCSHRDAPARLPPPRASVAAPVGAPEAGPAGDWTGNADAAGAVQRTSGPADARRRRHHTGIHSAQGSGIVRAGVRIPGPCRVPWIFVTI